MNWAGVWTASITPFDADGRVDLRALRRHVRRLLQAGNAGVVLLGSLGEGPALDRIEKSAILRTAVDAVDEPARLVAAAGGASTRDALQVAREAERLHLGGIMLPPPYVYRGDWRETRAHLSAVLEATRLPVLLYNNPVLYGTDITPPQIAELATAYPQLTAVKESSGDVRRFRGLSEQSCRRLQLLVGIDDQLLEGLHAGAVGWVAGLSNAVPVLAGRLFQLGREGSKWEADAYYRWLLPLLRLDAEPKFVQEIKFAMEELGVGSARVRPPRQQLSAPEKRRLAHLVRRVVSAQARPLVGQAIRRSSAI